MRLEARLGRAERAADQLLDRLHREVGVEVAGMVERVLVEVDDRALRDRLRARFVEELRALAAERDE